MAFDPVAYFNLVQGRAGGHVSYPQPTSTYFRRNPASIYQALNVGSPSLPRSVISNFNKAMEGANIGSGSGGAAARSGNLAGLAANTNQAIYQSLVRNWNDTKMQADALTNIQQEQQQEEADASWFDRAIGGAMGAPFGIGGIIHGATNPSGGGFSDAPIGKALDIISRPSYAGFEFFQSLAEIPESGQGWNPSDLWGAIQAAGAGVGRGLTGEDKTGFGQVVQTLEDNPDAGLGEPLRALERYNPELNTWVKRILGFGGEMLLDPLNFISGGSGSIIRETGENVTEATLRASIRRTAERIAGDFADANPNLVDPVARAAFVDRAVAAAERSFDAAVMDIGRGGRQGTRLLNDTMWSQLVSGRTAAELEDQLTGTTRKFLEDFWRDASTGNMHPASVDAYYNSVPEFKEVWDNMVNDLISQGQIPPHTPRASILRLIETGVIDSSSFDSAVSKLMAKYVQGLNPAYEDLLKATRNTTFRRGVAIKVGNKTYGGKLTGRAYDAALGGANRVRRGSTALEGLVIESMFPSVLSLQGGRARSLGMQAVEKFQDTLREMARQFTADQAAELQRLLLNGNNAATPEMQTALDFLRTTYDDLWNDLVSEGVYAAPNPRTGARGRTQGTNFAYQHIERGRSDARLKFKEGRKASIGNTGSPGIYDAAHARTMGLQPTESAFENLRHYFAKSRRDLVRAHYRSGLVERFGLTSSELANNKGLRNLTQVSESHLPDALRNALVGDEKYFLPSSMHDTIKQFNDITGWMPKSDLGRKWAKIINSYKRLLTLPSMGFHLRNLFGDVMLGLMDDINPNAYAEAMTKFLANKAGKTPIFHVVPGLDISWDEMIEKYKDNVDSSFYSGDDLLHATQTAGMMPHKIAGRGINAVGRTLEKGADTREFIGRFVHFQEAFKQEARKLWESGMRDLDTIEQRATDAAMWRVNQYKFDYNALTVGEKKLKTMAVPFYTYLRKAMPLLIEQMFMNPHYLSSINRFMQYNDGSAADGFNNMNIPQYIRDLGFAMVPGGSDEEPMALTSDIFPMGSLQLLSQDSVPDFFREALSNLNPGFRGPIEMAMGKEAFSGRPTPDNAFDYLMEQLPILPQLQEYAGFNIPGVPGDEADKSVFGSGYNWLSNRLLGLGIPARQITRDQQLQQQRTNADRMIEQPIEEFNRSQDAYNVYQVERNGRLVFMVSNKQSSTPLAYFETPEQAIEWAKNQAGSSWQPGRVNPLNVPTFSDVGSWLGGP